VSIFARSAKIDTQKIGKYLAAAGAFYLNADTA
jgi:hypothetical protein